MAIYYTRQLVIALILVMALVLPTWAVTYYVDATNGNDSWDGTHLDHSNGGSQGPWKSISQVNSATLSAGNSILFKRGQVWREQLNCQWSGSAAGGYITFGAYGLGNKPIIHGGTPRPSGWVETPPGSGIWVKSDMGGYGQFPGFLEDSKSLGKASNAAHVGVDGNWCYDNVKIYYRPTDGANPATHSVDTLTRSGCFNFSNHDNSYVKVDSIHFIGFGVFGNASSGSIHHIIIQNCDFTDVMAGVDITAASYNNGPITIQDCTFNNCGGNVYIKAGASHTNTVIVQRNLLTHANECSDGYKWTWLGDDTGGLEFQNLVNSAIEHNEISGFCESDGGIALWTNVGQTGNKITYNYIHDILGSGIALGGTVDGVSSCTVAYNIIRNIGRGPNAPYGGLRLNRRQNSNTPSGIYNNVLANCDVSIFLYSMSDYYTIKNNISKDPVNDHVRSDGPIARNIINNNCYSPDTGNKFMLQGTHYRFDGWKRISSQDLNSITSDPKFLVNGGDFRLASDSPCVNAGVDVGLTQDYFGNPVPGYLRMSGKINNDLAGRKQWSMGVYEPVRGK